MFEVCPKLARDQCNVRLTAEEELDVVDQTTASARVTEAQRASFRTRRKNRDEKTLEEIIAADPLLLNRASYLRLLVHHERKLLMNDQMNNNMGHAQGFLFFTRQYRNTANFIPS